MTPTDFIAALERASTRRTTPLGSGEIVWHVWGQGKPLLLLHGGTGSWMHWVRNVDVLARDAMVVVPDIPGSGDSSNPEPPISAAGIATAILRGLEEVIGANTHFNVAGFSMGGLIAGFLAQQAGARADTLVLVGSTATGAPRPQMEPLQSWRRLPSDAEQRATHRINLGILMIHDRAKIDALAIEVQTRNALRSRIRGKHVSHTGSLEQCLMAFPGRLAGIWGEYDATATPYLAERREKLQSFNPHSSFDILPGAGHWVQYEEYERFNRRMRELLNGSE